MILQIFPPDRSRHTTYLKQYFELRKRIFCDELGWVEAKQDGTERDGLDDGYSIYILIVDDREDRVVAGVRIAPTTGETLVHTVWVDMLPEPDDFRSPVIWEATRFCVDDSINNKRKSSFVNVECFRLMFGLLDFCALNGITSIIAVSEQRFIDMISSFESGLEVISEKTEADGCRIACVLWPTDQSVLDSLEWARNIIGDGHSEDGSPA